MSNPVHDSKIHILSPGKDPRITCLVETPSGGCLRIYRGQSPSLILDTSRPTFVGFQWPPWKDTGPEPADSSSLLTLPRSKGESFSFSYVLDDPGEVEAFFPIGESSYHADLEVDQAAQIVWFQLPDGQSIHGLNQALQLDDHCSLSSFVGGWFARRKLECPVPFDIDSGFSCYEDECVHMSCESKSYGMVVGVHIPAALLQDPIRNGSEFPEHGFNPWNLDQKAQIIAHLERELIRLTDFCERDASSRKLDVPAVQ
jgi:hypothetical protein